MLIKSKQRRSTRASSIVELVGVIIIMVPIALLSLNIGVLAFSAFYGDAACHEAARAAGQQTDLESAQAAATNALENYSFGAGGLISPPTIKAFKYSFHRTPPDPLNPSAPAVPIDIEDLKVSDAPTLATSPEDGGNAPNVLITVNIECKTPAPMLIGPTGLTNKVVMSSSYSFPIVYGVDDDSVDDTPDSTGADDDPVPVDDDEV